ncbi:hypothetical protein GGR50DRAFT_552302 [Xylaria sp. CBS 124048]|nr:hypothetical protein GGR50DRAFT_552302 [Xylaria sp. CBS 124048]
MPSHPDAEQVAETGRLTISSSMIIFVFLTLPLWALMGFQVYQSRKKRSRLPDLETGHKVGTVDPNLPLEDLLQGKGKEKGKGKGKSHRRPALPSDHPARPRPMSVESWEDWSRTDVPPSLKPGLGQVTVDEKGRVKPKSDRSPFLSLRQKIGRVFYSFSDSRSAAVNVTPPEGPCELAGDAQEAKKEVKEAKKEVKKEAKKEGKREVKREDTKKVRRDARKDAAREKVPPVDKELPLVPPAAPVRAPPAVPEPVVVPAPAVSEVSEGSKAPEVSEVSEVSAAPESEPEAVVPESESEPQAVPESNEETIKVAADSEIPGTAL